MHKQHCTFNQYNTCTAGISIEASNFITQYVWDRIAKKKDGTGVGLFLARKLAKQIGGDLRLLENDSIKNTEKLKNLKKKNIFYLELPIKELHA